MFCFGKVCFSIVENCLTRWCRCQLILVLVEMSGLLLSPGSWYTVAENNASCHKSNLFILRLTILKYSFDLVFNFYPNYVFAWSWYKLSKVGWMVVSTLLDLSFYVSLALLVLSNPNIFSFCFFDMIFNCSIWVCCRILLLSEFVTLFECLFLCLFGLF